MIAETADSLELDRVLSVIEGIPVNSCGGGQPRFLLDMSLNSRGTGAIVEIGSLAGASTIALAFGQKAKAGQQVFAIDCDRHPDIEANLEKAGLSSWVTLITGRSSVIGRDWRLPIEVLFIDGNHSYWGVRSDINLWMRHVVIGGKVVFHDYGHEVYRGVHRAVQKYLVSKPTMWRTISDREAGSLYVLQRLADSKRDGQPSRAWRCRTAAKEGVKWLRGELSDKLKGSGVAERG